MKDKTIIGFMLIGSSVTIIWLAFKSTHGWQKYVLLGSSGFTAYLGFKYMAEN